MLSNVDFYFFSPSGGTRKTGEILAGAIADQVRFVDLGKKEDLKAKPEAEVIVAALPVFGGRIPAVAGKKLQQLQGQGKKAVTLAVYGTRAYEDALLELNDLLEDCGFEILASGAFVAQHSMNPEIGAGRPDEKDAGEIRDFGKKILAKLEENQGPKVRVPGNHPYKPVSNMCPGLSHGSNPDGKGGGCDRYRGLLPMHGLRISLPGKGQNSASSYAGTDEKHVGSFKRSTKRKTGISVIA